MDCLIQNEALTTWVITYGPIALFILLAVGILALPVPEETLMVLTGILMHGGKLPILETTLAAYGGSICGITMSYFVGRTAGLYLVQHYGKWVGLTAKMLEKVHNWFEKWGKWTLVIGYFIPGVRHFTGLIAGTSYLEYNVFALFAYVGALLWVSTFLSIGYFFGNYCVAVINYLSNSDEELMLAAGVAVLLAVIAYIAYRKWKKKT